MPPTIVGLIALASLVLVVAGLRYSATILAPVCFAITLAILFTPLQQALERRGVPRNIALLMLLVGLLLFVTAIALLVLISLAGLRERLPYYQEGLAARLEPIRVALARVGISPEDLPNDWLNGAVIIQVALSTVTGTLSSAVSVVFFLFTLILLMVEWERLGQKLRAGLPPDSPLLEHLLKFRREIQVQYRIQTFSNLLSAVALTVEFLIFRIDFALLWGFLAFILGYIPNFGLLLACLPAILLAFILHGPGTALAIVGLGIMLNAAMDNLVTPRFMAGGLQLPLLVSFLAFLFWGWVFGPLGALLAIPATLFVRAVFASQPGTYLAASILGEE